MATFQAVISAADSETFTNTLYRFLEAREVSADPDTVSISHERLGEEERVSVTLWSDRAAEDFERLWRALSQEK